MLLLLLLFLLLQMAHARALEPPKESSDEEDDQEAIERYLRNRGGRQRHTVAHTLPLADGLSPADVHARLTSQGTRVRTGITGAERRELDEC